MQPLKNRASVVGAAAPWCIAVLALGLAASFAGAAVERLPQAVRTNANLSSSEKQEVQKFVADQIARLRSTDAVEIEEARRSLMSSFEGAEPSIGFRLEFGRAAASDLKRLVSDSNLQRAINATLVAGACGTSETIDVVSTALADRRPAVRAAAATAIREVITTSADSRVRRDQGLDAIRSAGAALAKESDPVVALALVASLEPARGTQFHGDAANAAGAAMVALTTAMPAPTTDATVRGAEAIQRVVSIMFTRLIDPAQASQLGPDYYKAVVSAGASALGYASRNADEAIEATDTDAAATMGLLVAAAEQSVQFGLARMNDRAPESSSLKADFDAAVASGNTDQFQKSASDIIARAAKDLGKKPSDFGG